MPKPRIHADRLAKAFGPVRAVRGVSIAIDTPGVTGLLGPNGAGKSTTIRMLTGFTAPDTGSASIAGVDLADHPAAARANLGYAPETAPLYPELTPAQYLDLRARLYGLRRPQRRAATSREIHRCRLVPVADRRIGGLSKGYRQRVALAAALAHDPPVVILDEPASGLDPAQIIELRKTVLELGQTKAVLLSSHVLAEIEKTCDRVVIIAAGRVLADGAAAEVAAAGPTQLVAEFAPPVGADPALARHHAAELLARVPGLESSLAARRLTDAGEPWVRMTAPYDADTAEALAKALVSAGWRVRELRAERPTLEARFVQLLSTAADTPRQPETDGAPAA
ncbi:MAG: ABC transporter ATP-binding protein [Planctomycetota bacterium]